MQMDAILLVGWVLLVFIGPILTVGVSRKSIGASKAIWMLVVAVTSWIGVLAYYLVVNRSTRRGDGP